VSAGEGNAATNEVGSGRPIEAFREFARSLAPEGFEARFGGAFLLLASLQPRASKDTFSTHLELLGDSDPTEHTGSLSTLVYPLRSKLHIVTLGRGAENDVVIPDRSVSRSHAFLKRGADGGYLLLDAGSSNGSMVNGRSVPAKGSGEPSPVAPGDTVRLGRLEFTFVGAAALREYAAKLR
jgi:pSer/pThr/pTyr-binding forkhead associated (FHA) protein